MQTTDLQHPDSTIVPATVMKASACGFDGVTSRDTSNNYSDNRIHLSHESHYPPIDRDVKALNTLSESCGLI